MLITHKKLQPVQCYHIFSNSRVVYLAKNHYGSYSPQMVPTIPPGSWPISHNKQFVSYHKLKIHYKVIHDHARMSL